MPPQLHYLLRHLASFDEDELSRIGACFHPVSVKKGTILVREGQVCSDFYYVQKGCLRTYFITRQGREKTRYIMMDCSIGTALTSFITRQPTFEFLDAVENSTLWVMSYQDFYRLNREMPAWQEFYRKMLEMAYTYQNKLLENRVTLNARQRYELMMENNPHWVLRLSNKVLASCLDMTQETLSRLKSG